MDREKPHTTEAQKRAKKKYMERFVEIKVRVTPEKRTVIQEHAQAMGESATTFINRAIDQAMGQDGRESPSEATGGPQEAGAVSLPPSTLSVAQEAADAAGEAVVDFMQRAVAAQAQRDQTSLKLGINPATGDRLEKEA